MTSESFDPELRGGSLSCSKQVVVRKRVACFASVADKVEVQQR